MIIYIYGSDSFKKDIHDVLQHSNIKFRLDEHGEIKDLKTLDELKEAIEDNPNNIYLIDDEKIIKKNSLNQKIKFLKPKDGIEQEYLLDHGIGDLSVDSIDELSKHIIRKLEAVIHENESTEIQESIVEIVEDAYEQDENEKDEQHVQLDDELSALLSNRDEEDEEPLIEQIDDISSMIEEENESQTVENEDSLELKDLSFEEDSGNIELHEENNINIEEIKEGVDMADEFSEFDTLNEADLMAALDGVDEAKISNETVQQNISSSSRPQETVSSTENLDLGSSNVDDIAKLISQLLNNKTLEITVKVKN